METSASQHPTHRPGVRYLLWWIAGALILVVGLWNGPQLWAVGLATVDTPCLGNGSIPSNVPVPLYLVRGATVTYTLGPCTTPAASVTVTTTQIPTGLIGIAPVQLIFRSTARQYLSVTVGAIATNDPFSVTIVHGATSIDPNFNLSPKSTKMPVVFAIYDPPLGVNNIAGTVQGQPVAIPVLANDVDRSLTGLSVAAVAQPASGDSAILGTKVVFTPTAVFSGTATFTYTVADGRGNQDSALVIVIVNPPSQDEPQIQPFNPVTNTTGTFTQSVTLPGGIFVPVTTTVAVPAGAFTQTLLPPDQLVIDFSQVLTPTCLALSSPPVRQAAAANDLPITQQPTNLAFGLNAYYNQNSLLGQPLAKPLVITVNYDDRLLVGLDENTLNAYRCVSNAWTREGITFLARDTGRNTYTFAVVSVIGEIVFFARTPAVFAPAVIR